MKIAESAMSCLPSSFRHVHGIIPRHATRSAGERGREDNRRQLPPGGRAGEYAGGAQEGVHEAR